MTPVGIYNNISFGGFDASQPGVANETFNGVMPHCAVSTAAACNITATGYKADFTKPVATQVFVFAPAEEVDLMNPPTFGAFETAFQNLQNVTIAFMPVGLDTTAVNLVIDDLVGHTLS
ncbi:hypothetical protein OEA41_010224 [Lepraria neglecta]|uniref:Uncharacterized protein n=1 Tax=Lepraria neglecta TaxID=209136 RepID=A0AAD9YW15_9LECA|nr:hypothetical protein OEA41_010224 [Lepraria neglecta]